MGIARKPDPLTPDLWELAGVLHFHTRHSDGGASLFDVLQAADESDVDFMVVTDHHGLRPKREGFEGWYGNVLLIVGEEIGREEGHFMAVGHRHGLRSLAEGLESELRRARRLGANSFLTHPDGKGARLLGIVDHRWKRRDAESFDGLEIWSYMHDWLSHLRPWNAPWAILSPSRLIRGPSRETLTLWDRLGGKRRVPAFGGLDGHSRKLFGLFWDFPYSALFRTIRTHVLVHPLRHQTVPDRDAVLDALVKGRGHIADDSVADSTGFRFVGRHGNQRLLPGDETHPHCAVELTIQCPSSPDCLIRVIRDGDEIAQAEAGAHRMKVDAPGVYRVEVLLRGKAWIFSNPLYLR
jgi:hypothetical protein